MTMQTVSVVICTYERPALLARALASIAAQAPHPGLRLDVVVVDNSDSGSARAVAQAAAEGLPLTYLAAHPANISVARNAGVAATGAGTIAFLDDDQELEPGWLAAVAEGLAAHPHDLFYGPIRPRFEAGAAVSAPARAMFTRALDAEAGTELRAFGPGTRFALSTANCIVRRRALTEAAPFDPAFGQCGGEDFHLFCRLQRRGLRFGWLPDARATDFIPAHRCEPGYLARRHFAGGQAFAAALIRTSGRPRRDLAVLTARALVQLVLAPVAPLRPRRGRPAQPGLAIRLSGAAGKLFWARLYPLYRAEERLVRRAAP